jgi:uncharacterized protein YqjF (DUF2071 family)
MEGVRPRWLPAVPWLSAFPELNVRTYVTFAGKPGVYFFSLDAGNALAAWAARLSYHLPYFHASMSAERDGDGVRYRSHRVHRGAPPAELRLTYRPNGPVFEAAVGSLEDWLTTRLCLYAVDGSGCYRADIFHRPWPLQPAEATIEANTMAEAAGIVLPDLPPLLHFSRYLAMQAWWPRCVA